MKVQPYVFFDGRCEEGIEFYKKTLGAEVKMLMRYKDCPPDAQATSKSPPGIENKVMHAEIRIGDATVLLSDGHCQGKPNFQGFALSLIVPDKAKAEKLFNGLAEGGKVQMPLSKTFFSESFGMCADKFGVGWMVLVEPK
jgi:PhnB protein